MPLSLIYPVLAQIVLTLVVGVGLGVARQRALAAGRARLAEVALDNGRWDDASRKWGNNFDNQFQTPVLFYVLCGVATFVGAAGAIMAVLAWAYVATRAVHVRIHTGANDLKRRRAVFAVGLCILLAMLVGILARLAF